MAKPRQPVYRANMDDAPRPVAALARGLDDGAQIPFHMHRRGQLLHATVGVMRVETDDAAWIIPPARALWMPPRHGHGVAARGHIEMRTVYIEENACAALPQRATLVEVTGLLRELILALLEEPVAYDEDARGGQVARLLLTELGRLQTRAHALPMPHDARALKVARALLDAPGLNVGLDDLSERAGASRRTLARLFRAETGLGFAEWRTRLRALDGLARLGAGASVGAASSAVGYASPSAFTAMVHREFGAPPRRLSRRA
jgi:AraC-like DNA-binding protein